MDRQLSDSQKKKVLEKSTVKLEYWLRPIGYFEKPAPSFISGFLSILGIFLWLFGMTIYFADPSWGFYSIIFGTAVGFFSIHTKRIFNDKSL